MKEGQDPVARHIQEHIEAKYRFRFADLGYDLDTDLPETGAIDSFGMIELVTWLEERFGIAFSDDDLASVELATVAGMAALISRLGGAMPRLDDEEHP